MSDNKLQFLARIPFSAEAQKKVSERLSRYIHALFNPPRKCLVLDMDNTLWGGIVAEDGLGGIHLGEDYPGNIYKSFQKYLLTLRARGVLLTAASKNDEKDALAVLEGHTDCLIKKEHFSAFRINWNDKASSLREIASELNIGLDSLVFFDDSPVEREWVRENLPEVVVVDVPKDTMRYREALEESGVFDYLVLSEEDRKRPEMYKTEGQRKELNKKAVSLNDFLAQLHMTATIGKIDDESLPRVTQLLIKTNQFNATSRRYSASEINKKLEGGAIGMWIRVSDRFGDNGMVGLGIVEPEGKSAWRIDCFLLSCRIIGRGVEDALLSVLAEETRKNGGSTLIGEYIPSKKNSLIKDFYPDRGFSLESSEEGFWKYDLNAGVPPKPEFIQLVLK